MVISMPVRLVFMNGKLIGIRTSRRYDVRNGSKLPSVK